MSTIEEMQQTNTQLEKKICNLKLYIQYFEKRILKHKRVCGKCNIEYTTGTYNQHKKTIIHILGKPRKEITNDDFIINLD